MLRAYLLTVVLAILNLALIKGTAEFTATANPGFLTIEGKGAEVISEDFQNNDNKISGTFKVKADSFNTGIDQRDEHMRLKYLQTSQYPDIVFVLDPVLFAAGTKKAFTGKLTLHGVTKNVNGTVEFSVAKAVASFSIAVTDFGIEVPTYKILTVGKDAKISVTIPL